MGYAINPRLLTDSGERCLRRVAELDALGLPPAQFVTATLTVVEIHVSGMLAQLIDLSAVSNDKFGIALIQYIGEDFARTWVDRLSWLHRAFGISVRGAVEGQRLALAVELRNAVIHGDERLTDSQKKKFQTVLTLRKDLMRHLEVDAIGKFRYGPNTNSRIHEITRRFIARFDQLIRAQFPAIR